MSITAVAGALVLTQASSVGPVVKSVTYQHGLHAGDALVLGIWVLALAGLLVRHRSAAGSRRR